MSIIQGFTQRSYCGHYSGAKRPRCDGLTLSQLSQVDWDRIDLSEWTAMLQEAGIHPTTTDPADFIGIGGA